MNDNAQTEFERKLEATLQEESAAESEQETEATEAAEPETNNDEETLDPVAELESQTEDLKDQLLRARAEFDNYRKRTAREVDRIRKTAAESVIHDLLPVMDNLELALDHAGNSEGALTDGVRMVLKQLLEILERNGLEVIKALGESFDPTIHEAVSQVESEDVPADNVAEEYQRGYKLGGQILRPSRVVVSQGPSEPQEEK